VPAEPASFALDGERIRLADAVFVYLERMLAPAVPLPPHVPPRSYGVSPTGLTGSGTVVAAVAPGEAVWLGFQAVDPARPAMLRVRVERADPLDAVTGGPWEEALAEEPRNYLVCPPTSRLTGLRRPGGHVPFGAGRPAEGEEIVETLTVFAWSEQPVGMPVSLARPAEFTRLTGRAAEPLDPDHAYKGWRLP
jgi:hypothetical protein